MILYINGDSHSYGYDAGGPEFAYGKHIADSFNYTYVNHAEVGCSNTSIIERTLSYIENNRPDFIIIGWSTFEREVWEHKNKKYNVNSSCAGHGDFPQELISEYKKYVLRTNEHPMQIYKLMKNYCDIYGLHCELKERNIKHLFFNAYETFKHINDYNLPKYDFPEECYINPYNQESAYYFWLENRGFTPSNPKYFHHGADAHKAWADFLLPKVKHLISNT